MIPNEWKRADVVNYIESHGRLVQTQESLHARNSDIPRFEAKVTFEGIEGKRPDEAARTLPQFREAN
jgi:hypothetical protein